MLLSHLRRSHSLLIFKVLQIQFSYFVRLSGIKTGRGETSKMSNGKLGKGCTPEIPECRRQRERTDVILRSA